MTRVTILMIFLTLIVIVLNLKDGQNLPVDQEFFDGQKYKENYLAEMALQKSPDESMSGMEDHNHSEEKSDTDEEKSVYVLTKKADFVDGVHIVKMLNKGSDGEKMVFEPTFLRIKPGEKVRFIPVDKGHMAQTIKGGIPDGASSFASKVNETYTQTFEQAGAYAIKCKPHFTMGMVAMIVVGKAGNLDQIKNVKVKGSKGSKRWNAILAELSSSN